MDRAEAIKREDRVVYNLLNHEDKEAARLAFEAMREQEQREQGCEYCNGLPDVQREDFTMPNASKKDYDIVKINFCPMCGRKLKEGAE